MNPYLLNKEKKRIFETFLKTKIKKWNYFFFFFFFVFLNKGTSNATFFLKNFLWPFIWNINFYFFINPIEVSKFSWLE
jgi:Na+/H+ antiporter NhaA